MKIVTVVLLSLMLMSCNSNVNPINTSTEIQDVPCVNFAPIYIGQVESDYAIVTYPLGTDKIGLRLNELPAGTSIIHFKVSETQLTGNLAPGQFPIHINNPIPNSTYEFTRAELGISNANCLYYYIHLAIGNETGWAGNIKRTGRGQWYYYNYLCCN